MRRVFIGKFNNKGEIKNRVLEALNWIQGDRDVKPDSKVLIKPNFTYPYYKPGVTTSPEVIEALTKVLKDITAHIIIGESDGGYHSWKAEEAFAGHQLPGLSKKYGVKLINLSKCESINLHISAGNKSVVEIPFPKFLLEGIDLFITMPVPKVHAMTGVSLGCSFHST